MEPLPRHREELNALFGRCLLRLQHYELLMKRMVAMQSVTAVGSDVLPADPKLGTSSLGLVAGRFFEVFVVVRDAKDGAGSDDRELDTRAHSSTVMRTTVSLEMTSADHEVTRAAVLQLIALRNTLVHHFLERFDIWCDAGCAEAMEFLTDSCERIGRELEQLQAWARSARETQRMVAAFLETDAAEDFIVNGIAPDGVVDWSYAGIVSGLREAIRNSSSSTEDGWLPLAAAIAFLNMRYPEQTPEKYGCRSWAHVLHVSKAFDLRYAREQGLPKLALFRERSSRS
jgi:hypothetical protein